MHFYSSAFEGNPNDLDLGDEVEYTLTRKSAKLSAENIHRIPKGSIPAEVGKIIQIWAPLWQNQQNDLCTQQRLISLGIPCLHEKSLGP